MTGHPGEGKTAMAAHLALEGGTEKENCIKLESVRDWEDVDWSLRCFTTVIKDDIFGGISLDDERLREWKTVLNDIEQCAKKKELRVIITSRHYIKEEAKYEMYKIRMLDETAVYTVHLDSRNLSSDEMNHILTAILERSGIDKTDVDVDMCVTEARGAFNFKSREREDCVFGFPECSALFARKTLISHGSEFFKSPEFHFKAYIEQLYKSKESDQFYKFIALVAVWAEKNHTINETDLQNPQNVSAHIQNIADCFGITINHRFVETVRFSLNAYTNFLYKNNSGEYTFSHNVISDMVGVVLGKYNPWECIKLCQRDFLMKRITLNETRKSDLQVLIPEKMYTELSKKFIKLLIREDFSREQVFSTERIDVDIDVLNHEAFGIKSFVDVFTKYIVDKNLAVSLFNNPIMPADRNNTPLYLLDHILLNNHILLAEAILSQNELFLGQNTKLSSESVCVVIDKLPHLLSNVLKSVRAHFNSKCSPKQATYYYDSYGQTFSYPLIVAISLNKKHCAQCLLKHGAHINVKDSDGKTALHCAAYGGHSDMMTELLDWKADVNVSDKFRKTALHFAAERGHLNGVKTCLKYGADVNMKDEDNKTPLHIAASGGHSDVMKELLECKAEVNVRNKHGKTALHYAIEIDHLDGVKTCLKYGADVNMVDLINRTALHDASSSGHCDLMKELLNNNADVNANDCLGNKPLHFAAYKGSVEAVLTCLKYGADVSLVDDNNGTALHSATAGGHIEVMNVLMGSSADVNAIDKYGKTPMHIAAKTGNFDAVKACLHNFADVNLVDKDKRTALHFATFFQHINVMEALLDNLADVDAQNRYGNTPLHIAARKGHLDAVKMSLKYGAHVNLKNKFNKTARHYAASDEIKTLLGINKNDKV